MADGCKSERQKENYRSMGPRPVYSVGSTRDAVPCYGKNISATRLRAK